MGETTKYDYSVMVDTFTGTVISYVPVVGTIFNAATVAHMNKRLEEVEKQIQLQNIDIEQIKKFLETDEGYSFLRALNESVLNSTKADRIAFFIKIMKECCAPLAPLDVQYKTAIMQVIANMTDSEMLLLTYYLQYFDNVPADKRETLPNAMPMEVSLMKAEEQADKMNFADFLLQQENGDILLKSSEFFFLRLRGMGIIHESRRLKTCYYITPLGEELIKYIKQ